MNRFTSIDILRGVAMLIMALGHVRHFLHLPALTDEPTNLATTTPALFFTRWVSHYCAATFIFLSGISIFITGRKKAREEHSTFIITRGLWLIIVELLIITFGLTFNPAYHLFILQVIWATGWSMVLLGLLLRTSYTLILVTGSILFFGHNLLDYVQLPELGAAGVAWKLLFTSHGDLIALNSSRSVLLMYAILPWTGIMLLGYAFGAVYGEQVHAARRKKILICSGAGFIALFLLLRIINQYGDPAPWAPQKNVLFTILSFLNVTKYPVSLQYGCMTLGPVLLLLAFTEPWRGKVPDFLSMFGKVPLFYYVLHFFLIHIIVGVLFFATGHTWTEAVTANTPFFFRPLDFGFSLGVVYIIWIAVVLILYRPCRWFVQYKQVNKQWWMRYL
jgi:uncharacterized membrane protein